MPKSEEDGGSIPKIKVLLGGAHNKCQEGPSCCNDPEEKVFLHALNVAVQGCIGKGMMLSRRNPQPQQGIYKTF